MLDAEVADYIESHPKGHERAEALRMLVKAGYNSLIRNMGDKQAVEHAVDQSSLSLVVEMLSGVMKNASEQRKPAMNDAEMLRMMQMFEFMQRGGMLPANQQHSPAVAPMPMPQTGVYQSPVNTQEEHVDAGNHPVSHPVSHPGSHPVSHEPQIEVKTEKVESVAEASKVDEVQQKSSSKQEFVDEEIIDSDLISDGESEEFGGFDIDGEDEDDDYLMDPLELLGAKFT